MSATVRSFVSPANFGSLLLQLQPNIIPVSVTHQQDANTGAFTRVATQYGPIGSRQTGIDQLFSCPYIFGNTPDASYKPPFFVIHRMNDDDGRVRSISELPSVAKTAFLFQGAASRFEHKVFSASHLPKGEKVDLDARIGSVIARLTSGRSSDDKSAMAIVAGFCMRNHYARLNFSNMYEKASVEMATTGRLDLAALTAELVVLNYDNLFSFPEAKDAFDEDEVDECRAVAAYNTGLVWYNSAMDVPLPRLSPEDRASPESAALANFKYAVLERHLKLSRAIYFTQKSRKTEPMLAAEVFSTYARSLTQYAPILEIGYREVFDAHIRSVHYELQLKPVDWRRVAIGLLSAYNAASKAGDLDAWSMATTLTLKEKAIQLSKLYPVDKE